MKNSEKIIIAILIICLMIVIGLYFGYEKNQQGNKNQETKIELKLGHQISGEIVESEPELKEISTIAFSLEEVSERRYENQEELKELVEIISRELNITINDNWSYYIHYYDEEKAIGFISFTYWIGEEIETTKTIMANIENNSINVIYHSHLEDIVNESELSKRVETFKNSTTQEKYTLKENEFFKEETTKFKYYYSNSYLIYYYDLFYEEPTGIILSKSSEYLVD